MNNNFNLINGECIEEMKKLKAESFDLILVDPPYGTIYSDKKEEKRGKTRKDLSWDIKIDIDEMFNGIAHCLRKFGIAVVFCQEPFTSQMLNKYHPELKFKYKMIWKKNLSGNILGCRKNHVNYFEEILVFYKHLSYNDNEEQRAYGKLFSTVYSHKQAEEDKIRTKICHFLSYGGLQFKIPTRETYDSICEKRNLKELLKDEYLTYDELLSLRKDRMATFNIGNNKLRSNVLEYNKPTKYFHPTQKPIDLLIEIIETFSDEGDNVLDFTMGSGSTGVACKKTNRSFTGIELSPEFFEIAKERIATE